MIALLLSASAAWACGGYAAAEKMAYAQQVGHNAVAVSMAATIIAGLYVWRKRVSIRILLPMIVICLLHPGIWMDPSGAGCGREMLLASIVFTLQSAALLGWVMARPRPRPASSGEEPDQDAASSSDVAAGPGGQGASAATVFIDEY